MTKKYYKLSALLIACFLTLGCQSTKYSYQAKKITGLQMPESVVQAKDGRIFVSEIGEFGNNGDGQITVIDKYGKTSLFAKGLDDPKGLAIIGDALYVADNKRIIKITFDGKASEFVAATAFTHPPQFLNDLEADPQGNLYVSDSGDFFNTGKGGAIYKVDALGQVTLLINDQQDARVMAPNGLLADNTGNVLLYVDLTSGILYSLNIKTKTLTNLAEGFGGGDGLVHHSSGTMYVSDWKNGKVFSVDTSGGVTLLKEGYQAAADIAITKDEAYLMVPDMKAGELDFIPLK